MGQSLLEKAGLARPGRGGRKSSDPLEEVDLDEPDDEA